MKYYDYIFVRQGCAPTLLFALGSGGVEGQISGIVRLIKVRIRLLV